MARARNIKPAFFENDILAECLPLSRLLFIGLWTIADKAGRLERRVKKIKAQVLPYDNCDCEKLLKQLEEKGFILSYKVDEIVYIQILNFDKHQNPHVKESASTILAPDLNQTSMEEECRIPDTGYRIPDTLNPIDDIWFEEFWVSYPDQGSNGKRGAAFKGAKSKAKPIYEKLVKEGLNHETINNGCKEYAKFVSSTGERCCHATTWLNQERWSTDYNISQALNRPHGNYNNSNSPSGVAEIVDAATRAKEELHRRAQADRAT
tara:strand:- start:2771 stop:3562 length:792 start_codon:yes stop_codon:yes gene_type:complete